MAADDVDAGDDVDPGSAVPPAPIPFAASPRAAIPFGDAPDIFAGASSDVSFFTGEQTMPALPALPAMPPPAVPSAAAMAHIADPAPLPSWENGASQDPYANFWGDGSTTSHAQAYMQPLSSQPWQQPISAAQQAFPTPASAAPAVPTQPTPTLAPVQQSQVQSQQKVVPAGFFVPQLPADQNHAKVAN